MCSPIMTITISIHYNRHVVSLWTGVEYGDINSSSFHILVVSLKVIKTITSFLMRIFINIGHK